MATFLAALPVLAQDGWVNLFNGKNLDGWEEHSGRAKYTVEDGQLTGESVSGTGNSFLCTRQPYGNFVRRAVEFRRANPQRGFSRYADAKH